MDIELDQSALEVVARYHLLMMVAISLELRGRPRESRDLLHITKEIRSDMADAIVCMLVDALSPRDDYRALFKSEEERIYQEMLSEMKPETGVPLQ